MSSFTFATWNINSRSGDAVPAHLELLRGLGVEVVALQEVTEAYYPTLARALGAHNVAYSLAVRPPEPDAPRNRRLGCAVAVLDGAAAEVRAAHLLATTTCPERTLVADVFIDGSPLQVCSFHSPNGSQWGTRKALWFHEVTDWLRDQTRPTVFGIDANTPKQEGLPDSDPRKWWNEDSHPSVGNAARRIVGDEPSHGLKDAWRAVNPGARQYPVSYNRDQQRDKRPEYGCRYDFVFASTQLKPAACEYHFDVVTRAAPALSDHALVTARFEF